MWSSAFSLCWIQRSAKSAGSFTRDLEEDGEVNAECNSAGKNISNGESIVDFARLSTDVSYPSIAEWTDLELVLIARRFAHPKQTIGL